MTQRTLIGCIRLLLVGNITLAVAPVESRGQLTIIRVAGDLLEDEEDPEYEGYLGPYPFNVGGGDLDTVFNGAADVWELIVGDSHTVTITYRWVDFRQFFAQENWGGERGIPKCCYGWESGADYKRRDLA